MDRKRRADWGDFGGVGDFHRKFGLKTWPERKPHLATPEERDFRFKFLAEELREIGEGMGLEVDVRWKPAGLTAGIYPCERCGYNGPGFFNPQTHACAAGVQDLPKIADGLVDLVYVALGTAHFYGLPWHDLWDEVQRANMSKRRAAADGSDSARSSRLDVVKPADFVPPRIHDVLLAAGWPGPELPFQKPIDNTGTDHVCVHGVAMDVHCCNCHSGFIFDEDHVCKDASDKCDGNHGGPPCGRNCWNDEGAKP